MSASAHTIERSAPIRSRRILNEAPRSEERCTRKLWILDIYGFLIASLLLTMGTLGDRIGRRRLLIGAAAFGLASIFAAFATSAEMLIGARALLGIAGATLAPSTLSLLRTMFPGPAQFTAAIGVWVSSFSAGAAIGPLVGGLLLERFWWGSVFLISVPVMLLLLAVGPFLLPEYKAPNAGRLDLLTRNPDERFRHDCRASGRSPSLCAQGRAPSGRRVRGEGYSPSGSDHPESVSAPPNRWPPSCSSSLASSRSPSKGSARSRPRPSWLACSSALGSSASSER